MGGMSLGMQDAGLEVVAGVDCWCEALDVYSQNFEHPAVYMDLSSPDLNTLASFEPDIIVGGPPCQDFSSAGNREEGDRANLTVRFAEIVHKLRPDYFIMENVPGALKSQSFAEAMEILDEDYGITKRVLKVSDFGVPQLRKRMIVIGFLDGYHEEFGDDLDNSERHGVGSVREYFNGINYEFDRDHFFVMPRNYNRRGIWPLDGLAPTIRGNNSPIPSTWKGHKADSAPASDARVFTTRELALIQTFPSYYKLDGVKTKLVKMIGNAVPPLFSQRIGEMI